MAWFTPQWLETGGPAGQGYVFGLSAALRLCRRLQMIEPIDELGGQDKKAKSFILCIGDFPLQIIVLITC